jgi:hypothetical protein
VRAGNAIAAAVLAGVAVLLALDGGSASPGALSEAHARERLSDDCAQCHAGPERSLADACTACHADVAADRAGARGLHGTLQAPQAADCAHCHVEHHGRRVALSSRAAFARAGYPRLEAYDHAGLGFRLQGAHAGLACERCHAHAHDDVPPQGQARFAGLQQSCASCHRDPHAGRLGPDCAACHGQERPFAEVNGFDHARAWPLAGAHDGLACAQCHAAGTRWEVTAGAGRPAEPGVPHGERRDCAACHTSPHSEGFVRAAEAPAADASARSSCGRCHDVAPGGFESLRPGLDRNWHAASGFPLDAPHDHVACAQCHAGSAAGEARAGPRRDRNDCAACHADPHRGQFAGGAFGGEGCVACHATTGFVPPAFGDAHHARTRFPLTGSHLAVGCGACHRKASDGAARTFAGTPADCAACHADVHGGRFDGVDAAELDGATGCARCHTTGSFHESAGGRFDHVRWTGFALSGGHAGLGCAACHVARGAPDAQDRSFGAAAGADCRSCHASPHAGQFAVDGVTDCARCHAVDRAFSEPTFDHRRDSRFALDATHARLACAACHRPSPLPDGGEAIRYKPLGTGCSDCHSPGSAPAGTSPGER